MFIPLQDPMLENTSDIAEQYFSSLYSHGYSSTGSRQRKGCWESPSDTTTTCQLEVDEVLLSMSFSLNTWSPRHGDHVSPPYHLTGEKGNSADRLHGVWCWHDEIYSRLNEVFNVWWGEQSPVHDICEAVPSKHINSVSNSCDINNRFGIDVIK